MIRGKTGRVYGHLLALLTTLKALPLTYNKDLQEDKEPLFDTVDTITACTRILYGLWAQVRFKGEVMRRAAEDGYLLATDVADYLVKKGLDFRTAHGVVGKLVAHALKKGIPLKALSLSELKGFHPAFDEDVRRVMDLDTAMAQRNSFGGTAPRQVRQALRTMEKRLCSC